MQELGWDFGQTEAKQRVTRLGMHSLKQLPGIEFNVATKSCRNQLAQNPSLGSFGTAADMGTHPALGPVPDTAAHGQELQSFREAPRGSMP